MVSRPVPVPSPLVPDVIAQGYQNERCHRPSGLTDLRGHGANPATALDIVSPVPRLIHWRIDQRDGICPVAALSPDPGVLCRN